MLQSPTLLSRVLEAAPKPKTTSGVSWLSYKTVLSFVSTEVGKKKGFVDFVDRVTVIVSEPKPQASKPETQPTLNPEP